MDRNLSEPGRAFKQVLEGITRRIQKLERTVAKPGHTQTATAVRTVYPVSNHNPLQPSDGYWVWHTVCELDVGPGLWQVYGEFQVEFTYTFVTGQLGRQRQSIALWTTPLDVEDETLVIRRIKTPMAEPTDEGTGPLGSVAYLDHLSIMRTVSSETGLSLRLKGILEHAGGSATVNPGVQFFLGPGQLIATPL